MTCLVIVKSRWRVTQSLHGKKPTQEFCPVRRESAGKTNHHRSDEQDEPQISARSLPRNAKQQRRVFHRQGRWCVQSSGNPETGTSGQMGHGSNQQRDWSTVESERWKVDRGQTRSSNGPSSNTSVAVRGSTNPEGGYHQARHH